MKKSKNKNKLYLYLGIFFALFILGLIGFIFLKNKPVSIPGTTSVTSKITTIREQTSLYKITAEYPVFSGVTPEFNNKITSTVTTSIENYKKNANDNWKSRQDAGSENSQPPEMLWTYQENWWQSQINDKYISFGMDIDYFAGGANMSQEIYTFNYNFATQKEMQLSDLFPNMPNYLNFVSDYSKAVLIDQFKTFSGTVPPLDFIAEGTAPKPENFKNFTFDDDNIYLDFPKYQVAPGSYGPQKISIPREFEVIKFSNPDIFKKYFK